MRLPMPQNSCLPGRNRDLSKNVADLRAGDITELRSRLAEDESLWARWMPGCSPASPVGENLGEAAAEDLLSTTPRLGQAAESM